MVFYLQGLGKSNGVLQKHCALKTLDFKTIVETFIKYSRNRNILLGAQTVYSKQKRPLYIQSDWGPGMQ